MKIDRARAQKAFADYAAHYNAADAKVKLKIDHTYRVAELCARIAKAWPCRRRMSIWLGCPASCTM